jgi:hypothetical protein
MIFCKKAFFIISLYLIPLTIETNLLSAWTILNYLNENNPFYIGPEKIHNDLIKEHILRNIKYKIIPWNKAYLNEQSIGLSQLRKDLLLYHFLELFITDLDRGFPIMRDNLYEKISKIFYGEKINDRQINLLSIKLSNFFLTPLFYDRKKLNQEKKKTDLPEESIEKYLSQEQRFVKSFLSLSAWEPKQAAAFTLFLLSKHQSLEEIIETFEILKTFKISQSHLIIWHFTTDLAKLDSKEIHARLIKFGRVLAFLEEHEWDWLESSLLFHLFPTIDWDDFLIFAEKLPTHIIRNQKNLYHKILIWSQEDRKPFSWQALRWQIASIWPGE